MHLREANQLLTANPHAFEDGYKLLDNGQGLVAVRTVMPQCSGRMIEWWFSYIHTTEEYKRWHPTDHIFSDWRGERKTGRYIGGTHVIHERLGTDQVHKLKLNFRDPSQILDTSLFEPAGVSAAIYGRGGPLNLPLWSAHVLHLVHDTAEGCVMRSRFWLGDVKPAVPFLAGAIRRDMTRDASLAGLQKHCREEMTILAGFLPALFRSETAAQPAKLSPSAIKTKPQEQPAKGKDNMSATQMLIGGNWTDARSGGVFERRSPLDSSLTSVAPAASPDDARLAIDAAAAAFPAWSRLGPGARRTMLLKAAAALHDLESSFGEAMANETGASAAWSHFNVELATSMLIEAAALTTQVSGEVIPSDTAGSLAMGMRVPAGVVVGIAPWNAPVILGVRAVATPLACGNTVVLKGSEICPATHALIARAFFNAGFPPGVVNFITNAPKDAGEVVEALIAHPATRRVNFTGSTHVGKIIAAVCARYLKPAVLELGGKAPVIVLDDADLDAAVSAVAFGAFANSGQICMSTERIIVDKTVADAFVMKLAAKARSLPVGDPRKGPVVLGSVVDYSTVERCNAMIDDALAQGAQLVCGGKASSTFMAATLLDNVTSKMRIYHDESFGPVKPIIRVDGVEAAITCANDTPYGLSAAVFGRDIGRAFDVAKRVESGICHVNGPTVHDEAQMPFGGVKASGYGRFGGRAGIDAFTDLRWMTIQTTPRSYPF